MKKLISVIALVTVCALLFCACGAEAKPLGEIFGEMKTTYSITDMVEFSDVSDLNRFYGIAAEDVKDFAGGINNSGVDQEEIVMVLAANADAADRISEALVNRLKSKQNETKNYNPEQYAIAEKATVDSYDNDVSMFISVNADAMKGDFNSAIR